VPAPDAVNSRTTWLSTVNEDGSPHVTAVGALWLDGTFWFQTGAGTRKGRNVARDPRCSVAVPVRDADVVIEGDAAPVTEPGAVARIAKAWAGNGWPAEPDGSGPGITAPFDAPSQGPPPWNVYRIEPRSAIVTLSVFDARAVAVRRLACCRPVVSVVLCLGIDGMPVAVGMSSAATWPTGPERTTRCDENQAVAGPEGLVRAKAAGLGTVASLGRGLGGHGSGRRGCRRACRSGPP
jgi:hypothetical protein